MAEGSLISRRALLGAGAAAAGAAAFGASASAGAGAGAGAASASPSPSPSPSPEHVVGAHRVAARLTDIEHVVIVMQENRSFDHYFGTLSGVRGYDDRTGGGLQPFDQPDADVAQNPSGHVLPFRFDTRTTNGQWAHDLSHAWSVQHFSWNEGLMDGFVTAHRAADDIVDDLPLGLSVPPTSFGPLTMGHFTRADIPFHYALADAFTICDNYHCSVFGPTNPNRLMAMSGTIDAAGEMGGPCLGDSQGIASLRWESYPERLQRAGVDWFIYQEADCDTNNMLPSFAGFRDTHTELYRRGNTIIPTPHKQRYGPALAARLRADVMVDRLPQVSWVLASSADCEHPPSSPGYGARFTASILEALTSNPKVWAKTVIFYTFDENDGFFDHVRPPTPPPGTKGEYIPTSELVTDPVDTLGWTGPVGLGFRVPMIVMSPFSRGGLCSSTVSDHTSQLLFLERRFGVEVPYISEWRRGVVGDLTDTLDLAGGADLSMPRLPDAAKLAVASDHQASLPPPQIPADQVMPVQEAGPRRRRPSGIG